MLQVEASLFDDLTLGQISTFIKQIEMIKLQYSLLVIEITIKTNINYLNLFNK